MYWGQVKLFLNKGQFKTTCRRLLITIASEIYSFGECLKIKNIIWGVRSMKKRRLEKFSNRMFHMALIVTMLFAFFIQSTLTYGAGAVIDLPGEGASQIVDIPDNNLLMAIRELLDKPSGDITEADMKMILSLDAPNSEITSIEGLQYCTNITSLMVQNNKISDLSPLTNLEKLTVLYVAGNLTSDYSPVAKYYNKLMAKDFQYDVPIPTGAVRIDFTTVGDSTNMSCEFDSVATAVWHWSDGTTSAAITGEAVTKSGLGAGNHQSFLTISNGSALTRFGAGSAGQGHLVSISGLQNCPNVAVLFAYRENSLISIGETSPTKIREYHLMNTSLSAIQMDEIFADAVASGVQGGILWGDISGTSASDANKSTLQSMGWTLNIPAWTPQIPTPTGTVRIDFTTVGDSTNMSCEFDATATAVWHWSDGTTSAAISGTAVTKSGLGAGNHQSYLTISNGSALTRFGAGSAGQGHLVSISGLQNCPNMAVLFAYQENSLISIGETSPTKIREYHLMNTSLSATQMDDIFADAVASGVQGGTLWGDTSGTSASDASKSTLQSRGWTLNIPAWTPQIPVEVTEGAITFITEGSTFSPVIQVIGDAQVTWTFADGTTSSSNAPVKNYGSAGTRTATLVVTPWSAVTRINIGYDAGDGGSNSIEFVPNQNVSAVYNLNLVALYLRQWCSSYNQLTSLDFSNFIQLNTIECFLSQNLRSVNLTNTPELKRACFEDCDLLALDLSQSPKLEDLRGAVNQYSSISFGSVGQNTWHICVRDNQQLTNQFLFQDMSLFPNISELFIWNDNQTSSIRISSSSKDRNIAFLARGNHYTNLNLQGALQISTGIATVDFSNNLLANVDLTGCVQITNLKLQNNQLSTNEADEILATLDNLGRTRDNIDSDTLYVNISGGGNAQPSQAGYDSAVSLSKKGWTVVATGWTLSPSTS